MSISIPNQVLNWHWIENDFLLLGTKLDLSNHDFTNSELTGSLL